MRAMASCASKRMNMRRNSSLAMAPIANTLMRHLIAFICLSPLFNLTHAYSAMGDADIRDDNGTPCFSITEQEENDANGQILFSGVAVYEDKPNGALVWRMSIKPAVASLTAKECFRYGEIPPNADGEKPVELKPGKSYTVELRARAKNKSNPIHFYSAKFCLAQQADGKTGVHQIEIKKNEYDYEPCKLMTKP